MDKNTVIQFCSGSNKTGNSIVLSTGNTTPHVTKCTCHFSVTNNTWLNITGICTTKIYFKFLNFKVVNNNCGDFYQHVETTQVLEFVYMNNDTSADSYCKHLKTNVGE